MKQYIIIFLLVLIIIIYIKLSYDYNSEVHYVISPKDNNKYLIRRNNQNPISMLESANTLAEINRRVMILINYLDNTYKNDYTKNYFIKMLKQNYSSNILSEAAIDKRYTTFTINKNNMHICLRTRDQKDAMYDINLLIYVVLHELAHIANYDPEENPIIGHGPEFKMIFKFLVLEATKLNIYTYEDYTQKPREYCGIMLSSNIV